MKQVTFRLDDDEAHFALDVLLVFYNARSLKQQSEGKHVAPM